jgi:hypothetical protein
VDAPKVRTNTREKPSQKPQKVKTAIDIPSTKDLGNTTTQREGGDRVLGLTVRIEINLPAQGDQKTYDTIFKSIRENLLNG